MVEKTLFRASASPCNHALANIANTRRAVAQCKNIVSLSKAGRPGFLGAMSARAPHRSSARPFVSRSLDWFSEKSVCMPLLP
jgi:hypothetical protein